MKLNIQTKLFAALAGLTLLVLIGVLLLVTNLLSRKIEQKIIADFNNTRRVFSERQRLIYDRLVESSYLIAENSTFKANVALQDPPSVYFSVEEFSLFAKVDLMVVTDASGKVLARLRDPERFGDDLSFRSTVFRAINGQEPDTSIIWPELWSMDEQLFQVVSLPVYAGESLIGTLTLGARFTPVEAHQLKGESGIDISIFNNQSLVGSTLDSPGGSGLTALLSKNQSVIDSALNLTLPTPAFIDSLNGQPHYVFISPLGKGEAAFYIASIPTAVELSILTSLRNNILLTGGGFLLLTIILAYWLGRNFSRPILALADGMNQVKSGNLEISVRPSSGDEIGLLTSTFNEMIQGLRERLHLSRYVGSHTLEMVKKVSTSEVSLGGTRQNLAVLFSDVRGFTAYSENRPPEAVIQMLNRYLGFQAEIVAEMNGSVDKFVGDEMFALFSGEDAVERALDCAVRIQQRVRMEHQTDPQPIHIGIGINYGAVILGNMGAQARMDYTALGAVVNLGARLCSAAGPGQILIRSELLIGLQQKYNTGQLMPMAFKGFSREMQIAEVLSA